MAMAHRIHEQLEQVTKLEAELETFNKIDCIDKLNEENAKLKYQLLSLEKAIVIAKHNLSVNSTSVLGVLVAVFDLAIKTTYPELKTYQILLNPCTNPAFGDYQCNSAMSLSKTLDSQGIKKSPREIAEEIIRNIIDCGVIDKYEIAPAGFINIFLHRDFIAGEICKIVNYGVLPPKVDNQRVIVDYSSPNIAKEMHVGHLRSTIIGDCIARFLRFLRFDVLAVNHIGDWGTQFGMLIAHLQDIFPNYKTESPPISDLAKLYKDAKKRFDEDTDFKQRAYNAVVLLQKHEEDSIKAWKLICDVSRNEFQKIYARLGVKDLTEKGESFYQKHMEDLVSELEKREMLELDENRKILRSESDVHMLMVKSDGGYTYDTSDMAAIKYRLEVERADSLIYVVDCGQGKHFEGLFEAAKKIGVYNPLKHRVVHVGFGVVLGADKKKFKSRANETVRLIDLLDEGMGRSLAKLQEKGRDQELTPEELQAAQEAVAYGCIKYADLSHHRVKEYIFSFDKMLEDKGNTAVYLLYAYTRISGIARNAKVSSADLQSYVATEKLAFNHEKEWKLAKAITKFPEILLKFLDDFLPHSICDYLYELCCTFTEFYEACYCVEKDKETGAIVNINKCRIVLAESTAQVLKTGFHILGLNPVQKM